jgi:hypothetical protein
MCCHRDRRSGYQYCGTNGIVELEGGVSYSYLKATMGSTRIARRAGNQQARKAESSRAKAPTA